jgi:hypothetical protein
MNQAILNNETLAAVAHHPAEGVEILDLTDLAVIGGGGVVDTMG